MNSNQFISGRELLDAAEKAFYDGRHRGEDELRLMLLELLVKSTAGFYNSHTENIFLRLCGMQKKDGTANKNGRLFICSMVYQHSNLKPACYKLMTDHRA